MDIPFDCCPYSKEDAQEAINNLIKYFQNEQNNKNYFGLDDLGIINTYLNWLN